ncbi:glycosyltransferase family A protein, partial [Glycomyces tenuis]
PSLLGRLVSASSKTVEDGPLISVVMTAYRPGPELLTAVGSVLAQSWRNLELLLVDDASGPEYTPILVEAAALDERVQLLRQRANGGTYRARNRALGIAQGDFVTGLDSDDWAHPRWLEKQVAPLLAEAELVMTVAEGIRCSEDLELALTPQMRLTEPRSTSIMYRAAEVRAKVGFYDTVLKSGDTEFKLRIQRSFGAQRVRILSGRNLTIVRERPDSLSHGDVSAEWVHPARFAYSCAFKHWHQRLQRGKAPAFLPASAPERPFPAPRQLLERDAVPDAFDLVCAADWRRAGSAQQELLDRAAEAAAGGASVALVHYADWEALGNNLVRIAPDVLATAAAHGLEFVDPETVRADELVVLGESVLAGLSEDFAALRAERIDTVPDPQA